ncbi:CBS domain-containing protein [Streptomyces sp. NPDC005840]|uniref:CBS domain-containing protein n=1 Tax=Streptomyces sp. NPDC005840 TaxID=3157072 RepID=UPI0033F9897A
MAPHHRLVAELMTTEVVTVRGDTSFKEIAALLAEHRVTAVPVVDDENRPTGIVSEADLLRRQASLPGPGVPPTARPAPGPVTDEAVVAGNLMTSPAVTAQPQWSIVEAARVMERHGVKRLPVVDGGGRLVGIVSRADLLRVFLRPDHTVREEITGELLAGTLDIPTSDVTVHVVDGAVTLTGTVPRRSLVPVLERLCRGVDGVVDVTCALDFRVDDLARPAPAVAAGHRPETPH